MSKPILMPQVGQDLEEGKLIEWKVKVGDAVSKGDIVAVVESEKASFEVEAFEAGTVLDLLYKEGDTTKVLAPLMYVGDPNAKDAAAPAAKAPPAVAPAASKPSSATAPAPADKGSASTPPASASNPSVPAKKGGVEDDAAAVAESGVAPAAPSGAGAVTPAAAPGKVGRSSPLARRLASEGMLDLATLSGTGPRGAVVKRDIETALRDRAAAAAIVAAPASAPSFAPARPSAAAPAGGRLNRIWLRKGEGDPVVMIHGFGGDSNAWRVLAASAGLGRPILAVDLPGHGRSPDAAGTLQAMATAVSATLAEENVTAADLVGHSLGAAVAVAVAEQARFTVRSLFLLAPAGLGPDINGAFVSGFCRAGSEAALAPWMALLVADPAVIGPAFVQVTHETRMQPGIADAQRAMAEALFPDGTQSFSVRTTLGQLAVPVRIVFGAADRIIPAQHVAGLPGTVAVHRFPGVGHMPQIEARDAVARILAEHLRAAA